MGKLTVSTQDMFTYDELFDAQTRSIAQELAQAINQNSAEQIKNLKYKYADCKEFVKAKKFLDQKCKTVWDVFGTEIRNLPSNALKALGITNQPTLEFLLGDSVKYFEKTNGTMTVQIIEKILNNKNMSYTMEDIHKYLAQVFNKENIKYNSKTAEYLVTKHSYNKQKLSELGINPKEALKNISMTEQIKYLLKNCTRP